MSKRHLLVPGFLLVLWQGLADAGEPGVIREDDLDPSRWEHPYDLVELPGTWRYHAGDQPGWSDPALDDTSWDALDSLQTMLPPDAQKKIGWTGVGWFRLHLRIDPALWGRALGLIYSQFGAGEVYLDGARIAAVGRVGTDRETEETLVVGQNNPRIIPVRFSPEPDHVLAVRYSNFRALAYDNPDFACGFMLVLTGLDHGIENKAARVRLLSVYQMLFGVPLAFALLHFLLFLFYPESRENLSYALFAVSMAALIFAPLQPSFTDTLGAANLLYLTFKAALVLIILFGLGLLYQVFLDSPPWFFRWIVVVGVLALLFSWIVPLDYYYLFTLVFFPEMLRVVMLAVRRRKEGARIIGSGYILFSVACILQILIETGRMAPDYVFFPYIYGILALTVSMSVYLARSFALTNRHLERQLVQVRELSSDLESAYAQLEEHSRTLEQRVEERTREVSDKNTALEGTLQQLRETQNQLVMQEKMASLGNLVAGLVHEINTPIGAIKSMHDTLVRAIDRIKRAYGDGPTREDEGDGRIQSTFDVIARANEVITSGTERVIEVLRSLRSFARLDEAEFQVADLHEGLESTLTLLRAEIGERIRIVREYGDLPRVYCSPSQLNQVFMHLLKNAVQAISGSGEIRIATFVNHGNTCVRITDTGSGMPSEQLAHVFDFSFDATSSRVKMGIGLLTSYTIMQDHEGDIRIESEPGQGTEVTISLPIREGEAS